MKLPKCLDTPDKVLGTKRNYPVVLRWLLESG
jgi:hypothetical protein